MSSLNNKELLKYRKNTIDYKKQGKKNRASGADFERRVRKDLEEQGWFVAKYMNQVEFNSQEEKVPTAGGDMVVSTSASGSLGFDSPIFGKLVQAKNKWAGPGRPMMMGAGFPDFIATKHNRTFYRLPDGTTPEEIKSFREKIEAVNKDTDIIVSSNVDIRPEYEVIGVECKVGKYLDKAEKEKCIWLLENKVFSKILIASRYKEKNRIKIKYDEFKK